MGRAPRRSPRHKKGGARAAPGRAAAGRTARARAKALLRESGEALERGDEAAGRRLLVAAVAEDPTFVEPALALAAWCDAHDDRTGALASVEEAVRRGRAAVDRIPERAGAGAAAGPVWWHDEATRPYLKALVARGSLLLAGGEARQAAAQYLEVFELEPDDPIEAGVLAAEAMLAAGDAAAALAIYERLGEDVAVLYGRGVALLETGRARDGLVSLWLGLLVNPRVALEIVGPGPFAGLDPPGLGGDAEEAAEVALRQAPLWPAPAREVLAALAADARLRADLERWTPLAAALDAAPDAASERAALARIEEFLAPERIAAEAETLLARLGADPAPPGRGRLPVL